MAGKGRQIIKLAGINLAVLASLVLVAELLSRAYEGLTATSKYQSQEEIQLAQEGGQCVTPPIVTEDGELSRYAADFSCAGTTIQNGLRLTLINLMKCAAPYMCMAAPQCSGRDPAMQVPFPPQLQQLINRNHDDIRVDNHGF